MPTPYGLGIIESCVVCEMRTRYIFCDLSEHDLQAFESIRHTIAYPKDVVLFAEGQKPRGIFVLCKGRVKLSLCAPDGKTLIMKIVEPGELLGLSAAISNKVYEVTAETIDPCQLTFVRRDDFLSFLRQHSEACLRVACQLAEKYTSACREVHSLHYSHTAEEKLATLLLDWSARNGAGAGESHTGVKLSLTHEEMGQMIGMTRETVSRTLAELKKRQIVQVKGSTLHIRNKAALREMSIAR